MFHEMRHGIPQRGMAPRTLEGASNTFEGRECANAFLVAGFSGPTPMANCHSLCANGNAKTLIAKAATRIIDQQSVIGAFPLPFSNSKRRDNLWKQIPIPAGA